MSIAIYIGIKEEEERGFFENKGTIIQHSGRTYLLRDVYSSVQMKRNRTIAERFVAELRPCSPGPTQLPAPEAVKRRVEAAFDRNDFVMLPV